MHRLTSVVIACVVLVAGCGSVGGDTDTAGPAGVAAEEAAPLQWGPCPELVADAPEGARCATFEVPADHADPAAGTFRIGLAELPARDGGDGVPVLVLPGAPGDSAMATAGRWRDHPLRRDHPILLVDQRGAPGALPALTCPELVDAEVATLRRPHEAAAVADATAAAARTCHDRLAATTDLTRFGTVARAADLVALRQALGIDRWDVVAVSYGTRLALQLLHVDRGGVGAVVLSSPLRPLSATETPLPERAERAFVALGDACASDPGCAGDHPGLTGDLVAMLDRLEDAPVRATGTDPGTGETVDVLLDGDRTAKLLFEAQFDSTLIPLLPALVSEVGTGEADEFADRYLRRVRGERTAAGATLSVTCSETRPIPPPTGDGLSRVVDGPVLVLTGSLDPLTPPDNAAALETLLGHPTFVEVRAGGHAPLFEPCPGELVARFLADPDAPLDAACAAQPPVFA